MLLGGVVAGAVQGVVWLFVAPGRQFKVLTDGSYLHLPLEDYHAFEAVMIFALLQAAIGIVFAAAAWQIRAIRGVRTLLTVVISAALGSILAYAIGTVFAGGTDPGSVGAAAQASIVTAGPTLATPLVMILGPLAAAASYTFLAAWDGRPNLGRGARPVEPARRPSA